MTRFVVLALLLASTVAAWAADVVVVEDWKSQKVGVKGIPEGWQGGQTWGLPQYDMTVVENDGHRVLHLKSKVDSSTISKDIGSFVPSQKTGMVRYVVVRTGTAELGKWFTERRNVVDDYVKVYGEQPENPGVISVAIDSDDTLSSAESFFGAILFRKP